MRIGYEYMLPGHHDTGVEVAVRETLSALANAYPEHQFEVYGRGQTLPRQLDSSNVHLCPSLLAGMGRPCRILWQQVAAPALLRLRHLDIYHATGYTASPLLSTPAVLSVYDTIALERPDLTRWTNALHYRLTVLNGVRRAARVIVPSADVKQRLVALSGIPSDNVEVIPLGVSACFEPLPDNTARSRLAAIRPLAHKRFILSVGNLERKKNYGVLIRAFAQLPVTERQGLALALVGKPSGTVRYLEKVAAELGIQDDIVFTGYVDQDLLVALYNQAEMLVYPSFEEGFGLPPLEAMACGTPVISSNISALRETIGDAALQVDPRDVAGLASAISTLLKSPNTSEKLNQLGRERAATFTWSACAQRTMDVYLDVVAAHRRIVPEAQGGAL